MLAADGGDSRRRRWCGGRSRPPARRLGRPLLDLGQQCPQVVVGDAHARRVLGRRERDQPRLRRERGDDGVDVEAVRGRRTAARRGPPRRRAPPAPSARAGRRGGAHDAPAGPGGDERGEEHRRAGAGRDQHVGRVDPALGGDQGAQLLVAPRAAVPERQLGEPPREVGCVQLVTRSAGPVLSARSYRTAVSTRPDMPVSSNLPIARPWRAAAGDPIANSAVLD